ncbi:MAG: hypothetical protein K6U89_18860, partial [Chloroflexi bacterium]|nr:hypothetical protein [Chloroflexota bacterium]
AGLADLADAFLLDFLPQPGEQLGQGHGAQVAVEAVADGDAAGEDARRPYAPRVCPGRQHRAG